MDLPTMNCRQTIRNGIYCNLKSVLKALTNMRVKSTKTTELDRIGPSACLTERLNSCFDMQIVSAMWFTNWIKLPKGRPTNISYKSFYNRGKFNKQLRCQNTHLLIKVSKSRSQVKSACPFWSKRLKVIVQLKVPSQKHHRLSGNVKKT